MGHLPNRVRRRNPTHVSAPRAVRRLKANPTIVAPIGRSARRIVAPPHPPGATAGLSGSARVLHAAGFSHCWRRPGQPASGLRKLGRCGAVCQLAAQRPAHGAQDRSTTEDGAYYLNGATSDAALLAVDREADWRWAIATRTNGTRRRTTRTTASRATTSTIRRATTAMPSNDLLNRRPRQQRELLPERLHARQPVLDDGGGRFRELEEPLRYVRPGRERQGVERDGGLRRVVAWVAWRPLDLLLHSLAASPRIRQLPDDRGQRHWVPRGKRS